MQAHISKTGVIAAIVILCNRCRAWTMYLWMDSIKFLLEALGASILWGHYYFVTTCRPIWGRLLYPPYPKDRGMLRFYVEAARRPQWYNSKTTGWIVLKFGIHIGSDSVLTWLTFQGRTSKVKVTASENDVIFFDIFEFSFLITFSS